VPPLSGAQFLANWNGLTVGDLFERIRKSMPANDPDTAYSDRILRRILEQYGGYFAVQLSMMTHADDTPWAHVWSENQGKRYISIPDDEIEAWFKPVLKPVVA